MHALQETYDALSRELATEKLQHAGTRQQLGDDLKARLLMYDVLPRLCLT